MDHVKHFIQVGTYTINTERINYVEKTDENGTVVHFAGEKALQLDDEAAAAFWNELAGSIGKRPNWPSERY